MVHATNLYLGGRLSNLNKQFHQIHGIRNALWSMRVLNHESGYAGASRNLVGLGVAVDHIPHLVSLQPVVDIGCLHPCALCRFSQDVWAGYILGAAVVGLEDGFDQIGLLGGIVFAARGFSRKIHELVGGAGGGVGAQLASPVEGDAASLAGAVHALVEGGALLGRLVGETFVGELELVDAVRVWVVVQVVRGPSNLECVVFAAWIGFLKESDGGVEVPLGNVTPLTSKPPPRVV